MSTGARSRATAAGRSREVHRLSADQVLKMIEAGVLAEGEDCELINGLLYRMTKCELHDAIVDALSEHLRSRVPSGYRVRREKSSAPDEYSLPEPDNALIRGGPFDFLPGPAPLQKMTLIV